MEVRSLLLLLAWLRALVGILTILRRTVGSRRWALRLAPASTLLGVALRSRVKGQSFLLATGAIWGLVVFGVLAGFVCTRREETLQQEWRFVVRLGLLVWASLFFTLVADNIANYVHESRYLLLLPEFAVWHVLDGLYSYLLLYCRPLLFSVYEPRTIIPRLWLYVVFGIEILSPGLLLEAIGRLRSRRKSTRSPLPLAGVSVLLVLLGLLAGLVWLRLQQGFLTGESALCSIPEFQRAEQARPRSGRVRTVRAVDEASVRLLFLRRVQI